MADEKDVAEDRKVYETVWNGVTLKLPEKFYQIAMAHVEEMRLSSEQNDIFDSEDEKDEYYLDPQGWKLSDTLNMALEEGQNHIENSNASIQEIVIKGLKQFEKELNLPGCCEDDDADDVFSR